MAMRASKAHQYKVWSRGNEKTTNHKLSNLLKEIRGHENLTQTEFAKRVGINRSLICQYESGKRQPSTQAILKISEYTKIPTDYLLGRSQDVKFKLTEEEEAIIKTWRRLPQGCELNIIKPTSTTKLDELIISVKQLVHI